MSQAILTSPLGSVAVNVVGYDFGYSVLLDSSQLQKGLQHYPIKALQDDFSFNVQFRSQDALLELQSFFLSHYKLIGTNLANPNAIIRFFWPAMSFDYAGLIKSFMMGIKKFEYAPKRTYVMQLVRDSIYTTTGGLTNTASWQNIYGTDVIDTAASATAGIQMGVSATDPSLIPPPFGQQKPK